MISSYKTTNPGIHFNGPILPKGKRKKKQKAVALLAPGG